MIRVPGAGILLWSSVKADAPKSADPFVPITVQQSVAPEGKWVADTVQ